MNGSAIGDTGLGKLISADVTIIAPALLVKTLHNKVVGVEYWECMAVLHAPGYHKLECVDGSGSVKLAVS